MEKISVIIPVYNGEKYIEDTLKSLQRQDYLNLEIIVINDGSTDKTIEILKKYQGKVKIINQKNGGASKARNKGIEHMTGKYLIFLDADDWLEDGAIKSAYLKMIKMKSDIILFKKVDFYQGKNCMKESENYKYLEGDVIDGETALKESLDWKISAVGIYKIDLLKTNKIMFREKNLNGDELTVRELFYIANKVTFSSKKYYYRIHEGAVTKTINLKLFSQLLSFKELKDIFLEKNAYLKIKDKWESISFGGYSGFLKIYLNNKNKFTKQDQKKIEENFNICLKNIDLKYLMKYEKKLVKRIAVIMCFLSLGLYKQIIKYMKI